jgi:hypothetical protein
MITILQRDGWRSLLIPVLRVFVTIEAGLWLCQGTGRLTVISETPALFYARLYRNSVDSGHFPLYAIWWAAIPCIMLISGVAVIGLMMWQVVRAEAAPPARWKPFYPIFLALAFTVVGILNSWLATQWSWFGRF